jgi:hypothetical protein
MPFLALNVFYKRLAIGVITMSMLFIIIVFSIHPFLSPTRRIAHTQTLVVEGWLSDVELKEALQEFNTGGYKRMITTGGPSDPYYRVPIEGTLHIPIPDSVQLANKAAPVIIEAYGSQVDGVFAHFKVYVNDSVYLGEAYTTSRLTSFRFPVDSCITSIKSLHIVFDNDTYKNSQDRDLFVGLIAVNDVSISYNSGTMVYEQHWPHETRYVKVYATYAENAAAELIRLGADRSKIVVLPAPKTPVHKTYHSAMAIKAYLKQHHITSCNVISVGVHSRRSWLSYEKALGKEYVIGIIALENHRYHPALWWQQKPIVKKVLREVAKYLYIRFWFDPHQEIKTDLTEI